MKVAVTAALCALTLGAAQSPQRPAGVAILQVDTDRRIGTIDPKIYGQFLEHINHSVEDGLFAEQIRGGGFEGRTSRRTGRRSAARAAVQIVEMPFERHEERADCRRARAGGNPAGTHLFGGRTEV